LIGKKARVTVEINNAESKGAAILNGQEWTARALEDDKVYPVDAMVEVKEIRGVKLIVSMNQEES
ncbi:MAG: NfeD family protein, partial [Lacrimispora sphenoides]